MAAFLAASASTGASLVGTGSVVTGGHVCRVGGRCTGFLASCSHRSRFCRLLRRLCRRGLGQLLGFSAFSRSSRSVFHSKRALAWSAAFFSFSRAQISLLAKRKYCTSGMRDGQTKLQQPHSMQSKMWYSCVLPKLWARENQYISKGCSSCGQTLAHSPQRMQGISGAFGGNSVGDPAMMQLVALTSGASMAGISKPIIGPPMR